MVLPWWFWVCVVLATFHLMSFVFGDRVEASTHRAVSWAALWLGLATLPLVLRLWARAG